MSDTRNSMILTVDGKDTPVFQVVKRIPVQVVTVFEDVVTYETHDGEQVELPEIYEMRIAE